ncbi:MAG: hypothetical protein ACR2KU_08885 [Gammaproteobacteria bacterium]
MNAGIMAQDDATDRRVFVKLGMMMDGLQKAMPRLGQGAISFFAYVRRMQAFRAFRVLGITGFRLE